jgi:hypothetical protein
VDKLSVIEPEPVFLTYTIWLMLPPAPTDPQFIAVTLLVQRLLEYTPMFGVVTIVPVDVIFWFTLMAANVEAVNAIAANAKTITEIFNSPANAILLQFKRHVSIFNKHYIVQLSISKFIKRNNNKIKKQQNPQTKTLNLNHSNKNLPININQQQ